MEIIEYIGRMKEIYLSLQDFIDSDNDLEEEFKSSMHTNQINFTSKNVKFNWFICILLMYIIDECFI